MKILIAGDSFCDDVSHSMTEHAWTRVLENILPNASVDCAGQSASSVFSALHTVREHVNRNDYDVIIVIVTNHERLYQKAELRPQISSLPHALSLLEIYKTKKDPAVLKRYQLEKDPAVLNRLEAGRMYYEYLYEHNLGIFILESCLKEFQTSFPGKKVILFPAFDNYSDSKFACDVFKPHPFNLMEVVNREDKNFSQLQSSTLYKEIEVIHGNQKGKINHMCQENQYILANYFADIIQHGRSDITIDSFFSPLGVHFGYYYTELEI